MENGLTVKLKAERGNGILAFTDRYTVKLDLDGTSFKTALHYAKRVKRWFRLEGFLILRSSKGNYHVVFNKPVTWEKNVRVMAWACFISSFNAALSRWFVMQCIKRSSTLRFGRKREKRRPRIVHRFGQEDKRIAVYLGSRVLARKCECTLVRKVKFFP
jgi:hypothetical protein